MLFLNIALFLAVCNLSCRAYTDPDNAEREESAMEEELIDLLKRIKTPEKHTRGKIWDARSENTKRAQNVDKRTWHKHGFIYFFVDRNHDYLLSRSELETFLDCSVFKADKEALLKLFMKYDKNRDGLDAQEWEVIESLSRHELAMELLSYEYDR